MNGVVSALRIVCWMAAGWIAAAAVAAGPDEPSPGLPGLSPEDARSLTQRTSEHIFEQGVVETAEVLEFRSPLPGEHPLVFLADDGSLVAEGDLLFELSHDELAFDREQQERSCREARGRLAAAEAALAAAKATLAAEESRLAAMEKQLAACRVTAPRGGLVAHPRPASSRSSQPLAAGTAVRQQQLLLTMPDLTQLRVQVRVHESQVARVAVGQQVSLSFDALPQQVCSGRVLEIGKAPVPTSWLTPDVVEYPVSVELTDPPPQLRLGMTALAEITVGPRE